MGSREQPSITEQAEELFEQTAGGRSSLELYDQNWPALYKISHLLHTYGAQIGYPQFIINPDDETTRASDADREHAHIRLGRDDQFPDVYLWQIALGQDSGSNTHRAMLHGRSAKAGERWQHIRADFQHRQSSVFIRGEASTLTDFVLRCLVESDALTAIDDVFALHVQEDPRHRLKAAGITGVQSAKKDKERVLGGEAYVQIEDQDLPEWVLSSLAQPIDVVKVPRHKPPAAYASR